jgi:hypothetical protein
MSEIHPTPLIARKQTFSHTQIVAVAGIVGALFGWAIMSVAINRSYRLSTQIQTFEQYLSHAGTPHQLWRTSSGHLLILRDIPVWHVAVNTPSSLPGYVFDRHGQLVDWSHDPGDDADFQGRWDMNEPLSLNEARLSFSSP